MDHTKTEEEQNERKGVEKNAKGVKNSEKGSKQITRMSQRDRATPCNLQKCTATSNKGKRKEVESERK